MADDVNKSNKSPMNGAFGASEIEKIGAQAYSIPKSEQEQRDRASTARTQIEALSHMPDDYILNNKVLTRVASEAPNTLMKAQTRVRSSVQSRLERSNKQAVNAIGREYSETSINSMANQMAQTPNSQNQALTMMGTSYEDLAQKRQTITGQLNTLGTQSAEAAGSLYANRGPRKDLAGQISGNAEQASTLVKELSSIDLAMKTRRQTGTDSLSKFEKLNATGQAAEEYLSAKQIGKEVSQGGVNISKGGQSVQVANQDISKAIQQEADNLKKALSDLANSAGKSSEDLDKMRKSAEESASNFEKLQKAQAAGGGGGGASGAQWASAAGGMFNAIGGGIQQIAVTQRLGQKANIAGYADIENQKYDMYKAGRGGDVMSQMLSTQWSKAEGFGRELKTGQQAAVAAYTAGGVAQTVAGGFQVAEGATGKVVGITGQLLGTGSLSTKQVLEGAQNVTQGLSTTAVNAMDLARGVSTNAAAQQGTQADMAARKAILKVQAEQLQSFRDYGVGMSVAAQGMGGRAEAFLDQNTSSAGLTKMADARLSPEQVAQMSKQGVAAMGSQFDTNSIYAARGLEKTGMGSMAENMQRMSALAGATTGVGGNNPTAALGSVLESAFSKSLDSSKAISAMVDNTAQMASSSSLRAAGADVTAASAAVLAANMNPNEKNQEFAVNRAQTAAEINKGLVTNTEVSFSGMLNTSRIAKDTGLKGTANILAAKMTPEELRTLSTMKEDEASKLLFSQGINAKDSKQGTAKGLVQQLIKDQQAQSVNSSLGLANMTNAQRAEVAAEMGKKGGKFSNLNESTQLAYNQVAKLEGFATGQEKFNAGGAVTAAGASAADAQKAKDSLAGKGGSKTLEEYDKLRTSGAKQMAEQTLEASKLMGGALKALTDMNNRLEKEGAKGAEGKFKDAAAGSAESFGQSTFQFERAVGRFAEVIDSKLGRSGIGTDPAKAQADAQAAKLKAAGEATKNSKPKK